MLEYVRKLLLAQAKLAAQFEPQAQQPEIREYFLMAQAHEKEEAQARDGARRKQQRMRRCDVYRSDSFVLSLLRSFSKEKSRIRSLRSFNIVL